eukprot:PhM_4_TR11511/c0_g1_i1/m.40819
MDSVDKERAAQRHAIMLERMREQRSAMRTWDDECKKRHNVLVRQFKKNREWEASVDAKVADRQQQARENVRQTLVSDTSTSIDEFNDNLRRLGIETKQKVERRSSAAAAAGHVELDEELFFDRIRKKKHEDIVSRQEKEKRQNKLATDQARMKVTIEHEKQREALIAHVDEVAVSRRATCLTRVRERNMKVARKALHETNLEEHRRRAHNDFMTVVEHDAKVYEKKRAEHNEEYRPAQEQLYQRIEDKRVRLHDEACEVARQMANGIVDMAVQSIGFCYQKQGDVEVYKSQLIPPNLWRNWVSRMGEEQHANDAPNVSTNNHLTPAPPNDATGSSRGLSRTARSSRATTSHDDVAAQKLDATVSEANDDDPDTNDLPVVDTIVDCYLDGSGWGGASIRCGDLAPLLGRPPNEVATLQQQTQEQPDDASIAGKSTTEVQAPEQQPVAVGDSDNPPTRVLLVWGKDCSGRTRVAETVAAMFSADVHTAQDLLDEIATPTDRTDGPYAQRAELVAKAEEEMQTHGHVLADTLLRIGCTKLECAQYLVQQALKPASTPAAPGPGKKSKEKVPPATPAEKAARPPSRSDAPPKPKVLVLNDFAHSPKDLDAIAQSNAKAGDASTWVPDETVSRLLPADCPEFCPIRLTDAEIAEFEVNETQVQKLSEGLSSAPELNIDGIVDVTCSTETVLSRMRCGIIDVDSGRHHHKDFDPAPPGSRTKPVLSAMMNVANALKSLGEYDSVHRQVLPKVRGLVVEVDGRKDVPTLKANTPKLVEEFLRLRELQNGEAAVLRALHARVTAFRRAVCPEHLTESFLSNMKTYVDGVCVCFEELADAVNRLFVEPLDVIAMSVRQLFEQETWEACVGKVLAHVSAAKAERELWQAADDIREQHLFFIRHLEADFETIGESVTGAVLRAASRLLHLEVQRALDLIAFLGRGDRVEAAYHDALTLEELASAVQDLRAVHPELANNDRLTWVHDDAVLRVGFIAAGLNCARERLKEWTLENYKDTLSLIPRIIQENRNAKRKPPNDQRPIYLALQSIPFELSLKDLSSVYNGKPAMFTCSHIDLMARSLKRVALAHDAHGIVTKSVFVAWVSDLILSRVAPPVFAQMCVGDIERMFGSVDTLGLGKVHYEEFLMCLIFFTKGTNALANPYELAIATGAEINRLARDLRRIASASNGKYLTVEDFCSVPNMLPSNVALGSERAHDIANALWCVLRSERRVTMVVPNDDGEDGAEGHTIEEVEADVVCADDLVRYLCFDMTSASAIQKFTAATAPTSLQRALVRDLLLYRHADDCAAAVVDSLLDGALGDSATTTFAQLQASHWGRQIFSAATTMRRKNVMTTL